MEATSIFIIILEIAMSGFIVYYGFTQARYYFRRKGKVSVKAPKLRGRPVLFDPTFGSALVMGYTPIGIGLEKAELTLMGRDGQTFSHVYRKDDLVPDNALHAVGGAREPVWRVKWAKYSDKQVNDEIVELEKRNEEMAEQLHVNSIQKKIDVNEAATLSDNLMTLFKELKETDKKEAFKVLK